MSKKIYSSVHKGGFCDCSTAVFPMLSDINILVPCPRAMEGQKRLFLLHIIHIIT